MNILTHLYTYEQAERSIKAPQTHRRTTTAHQFTPKYCAVDNLINKRKFSPNSGERHDPNKYSPDSFTRQFALVFPFIYVRVDAFMGYRCNGRYIGIGQGRCIHGHCIYTWTNIHNLCNHICIYTDTYVYQYIIPRRVITIYTRGKILQNLKPLCVCARARVCGRACVRGGNCEQIMNKM